MNKLVLNSYAKLNLYLEVLSLRKDNYHNIKTVFERIGLADKIILTLRRDKAIEVSCSSPDVPQGPGNLVFKSAKLLQKTFKVNKGVNIKIIKRIPVAAGLAGGSSNAATVLGGLNKLWKLKLSQKKLAHFGQKIGSDVSFFLYDAPFALGSGRGEKIAPLRQIKDVRLWHILVVPRLKVSTPAIYRRWDERDCRLTKCVNSVNILTLALKKKDFSLISGALFNGLQEITVHSYPEVNRIIGCLEGLRVKSILMSGSGPAVFGIVTSRKEAVTLRGALKKKDSSWRVFVTRTV